MAAAWGSRARGPRRRPSVAAAPASSRVSWQPTQPADLARLEADERPHAAQLHVVLVEQLEVEGRIGRHAELRAAVGLDRHVAQHADRVPVDHHRLDVRLVALAAVGVAVGPGDPLADAKVLDLLGVNPRGPLGRVLTDSTAYGTLGSVASGKTGGRGRGRSGIGVKQEMAGSR